jgi:hypothetical protein
MHPGKLAQPEDKWLFELIGIQPKGNSWEKLWLTKRIEKIKIRKKVSF